MKFGFKTAPQDTTWDDMLAMWRAADEIELYESGWTFDHFYPIFSDPTGPCLEGWTTLAALGQATRRVRIGVLVTGIPYRHPAVLANMAATLDVVSGGRLELGLGAGWNEEEADAYGIRIGGMKERFDRFDEALEVVTSLLANDTTSFEGDYFNLDAARCEPKPLQTPLPICIGGTGERRTLRSVARFAHHWNYPAPDPTSFRHKLEVLHGHCDAIGRDASEITTSVHLQFPSEMEPGQLADTANAMEEAGCDAGLVYPSPPLLPARLEEAAEALAPLASS